MCNSDYNQIYYYYYYISITISLNIVLSIKKHRHYLFYPTSCFIIIENKRHYCKSTLFFAIIIPVNKY